MSAFELGIGIALGILAVSIGLPLLIWAVSLVFLAVVTVISAVFGFFQKMFTGGF